MAAKFSDTDIQQFLSEEKPLPKDYQAKIQLRPKRGHREASLDVDGVNGNGFRLILRQNLINPLDFSVILAFLPAQTNQIFRLRRYNGKSHEHTNTIEGDTFYDFHVHTATERYQEIGADEDAYAEIVQRYAEYHDAIRCMVGDCGFELPQGNQMDLFHKV